MWTMMLLEVNAYLCNRRPVVATPTSKSGAQPAATPAWRPLNSSAFLAAAAKSISRKSVGMCSPLAIQCTFISE